MCCVGLAAVEIGGSVSDDDDLLELYNSWATGGKHLRDKYQQVINKRSQSRSGKKNSPIIQLIDAYISDQERRRKITVAQPDGGKCVKTRQPRPEGRGWFVTPILDGHLKFLRLGPYHDPSAYSINTDDYIIDPTLFPRETRFERNAVVREDGLGPSHKGCEIRVGKQRQILGSTMSPPRGNHLE